MNTHVVFLTIPGLRVQDLPHMPALQRLIKEGSQARICHSFPCVTWPSQAHVLTGQTAEAHGVTANGFYWRDSRKVEMWTAWNEVIERPQIWDVLRERYPQLKSAAWFPMLSKGCGADYVCMPAPIHKPDGSEDLWCYTKPQEFYGELLNRLGHFPLQHFWGPLANIKSSKWIADSALMAAERFQPHFNYVYLPHLDYAAQKNGPDSTEANQAVRELDELIGSWSASMDSALPASTVWMIASEYTITPVDHVLYPNRLLRDAGLLQVDVQDGQEFLDFENSAAWALVDHQFSHVYVRNVESVAAVRKLFEAREGVDQVLVADGRADLAIDHARSGEVVVVSNPNSWQAYYWWLEDNRAPDFASTVDIHRKPGYDPIELHFDRATGKVPLDASLAKGSHGAPARTDAQKGVFLTSKALDIGPEIKDTNIFDLVLRQFN